MKNNPLPSQWLLCLSVLYWLAQGARSSGGEAVVVNVRTSFLFLSFFACFSLGSLFSQVSHIQSFTLIFMPCLDEYFPFAGSWFWPNKLISLPIANQGPQFVPEEWWGETMVLYIAFYILSGIWINTIYPFAQSGFWPHQSALQLQILQFTPLD